MREVYNEGFGSPSLGFITRQSRYQDGSDGSGTAASHGSFKGTRNLQYSDIEGNSDGPNEGVSRVSPVYVQPYDDVVLEFSSLYRRERGSVFTSDVNPSSKQLNRSRLVKTTAKPSVEVVQAAVLAVASPVQSPQSNKSKRYRNL